MAWWPPCRWRRLPAPRLRPRPPSVRAAPGVVAAVRRRSAAGLTPGRRVSFSGALPLLGVGLLAGAAVASLLKKEKRVYGKGLAQFLPADAKALAKNIACVAPRVGGCRRPRRLRSLLGAPDARSPAPRSYHAEYSATTTSLTTDKLKARSAPRRRANCRRRLSAAGRPGRPTRAARPRDAPALAAAALKRAAGALCGRRRTARPPHPCASA